MSFIYFWSYEFTTSITLLQCDALRDLVAFVRFKNRDKKTHAGVLLLIKLQASDKSFCLICSFILI